MLFLGRLEQQKHPELALRCFEMLPESFRLVVAGDGPLYDSVASLAAPFGPRVTLVGRQPAPAPLMASADVVVMPSRYEGFGRVAIESLAAGAPLVHSDIPGLGEAVGRLRLGRQDVVAVKGEDPQAWAAAVAQVCSTWSAEAAERRHRATETRYGLTRAVDQYLALYGDRLLARQST
jgi:glycosyltransferase involved in cell wall biosynthesis